MIGLLQRVSYAQIRIDEVEVGAIARGLAVFVAIERADGAAQASRLLTKLLDYRVFPDAAGKMNLGLRAIDGGLLLVPQFTLAAATDSGLRPRFSTAAAPLPARARFEHLVALARMQYPRVQTGEFGADMQITLINDGPVTFWLRS